MIDKMLEKIFSVDIIFNYISHNFDEIWTNVQQKYDEILKI